MDDTFDLYFSVVCGGKLVQSVVGTDQEKAGSSSRSTFRFLYS